jgi:hypothetical protein
VSEDGERLVGRGRGDGGGEGGPQGRDPQQEVDERHAPAGGVGPPEERDAAGLAWSRGNDWSWSVAGGGRGDSSGRGLRRRRRRRVDRRLLVLAGVVVDGDDVRSGAGLAGAHGCCLWRGADVDERYSTVLSLARSVQLCAYVCIDGEGVYRGTNTRLGEELFRYMSGICEEVDEEEECGGVV